MEEKWIAAALEIGFSYAVPLRAETLKPMKMVRDMCAADKCHAYNRNWMCPPNCGTLEECGERIANYHSGILLQTVGYMKKKIDSRAIMDTEKQHKEAFIRFCEIVRKDCPQALCLGAGGCSVCSRCAYPEKCRFPDKAYSSMEAYGLFVTQVCRDNNASYYHGEGTITYSACVLFP